MILTTSYAIIIVKMKCQPPPNHLASVASERKLSVTLFLVTIVAILTFLPEAIFLFIPNNIRIQLFPAAYTLHVLYYASSLVNPLIYAIRMEEFRKAVKELFCAKRKPDSSRILPSEVLVMQAPLPAE